LLDAESGQIAWIGGRELTGSATSGPFERGTIYSAGRLSLEMMRSLLAEPIAGRTR
jgi:hypothetical protein